MICPECFSRKKDGYCTNSFCRVAKPIKKECPECGANVVNNVCQGMACKGRIL